MRRLLSIVLTVTFFGLMGSSLDATTLKEIQKRGTVRIGVKENLPLLGQVDRQNNRSGFEIELAEKITRTIWGDRIKIKFIPLLNQDRLQAITNGTVDMAIANLHVTDSRRRVIVFSKPYLRSRTEFVTRLPTTTFSGIKAGNTGVLQGSIAIGRLRASIPEAQLQGLASYAEAWQKLGSGELDSFAGDALILRGWQYGYSFLATSEQSTPPTHPTPLNYLSGGLGLSPIAIGMPKGLQFRNFHDAVNLAIGTLDSSGELQQMRNKWKLSLEDRTALDRLDAALGNQGFADSP